MKSPTPYIILILFAAVLWTQFNMARWRQQNVIIWDVIEYYSYLPALVQGDFTLRDSVLNKDFNYHAWALDGPRGEKVIKMSSGTALFYAPFFFAAYLSDVLQTGEINTFAPKYHMAVSLSAAVFLLLALIILARFLRKYFSKWVVALTLLLLVLGTNLFHYSTAEPGMSHVFSFFLFACFLPLVAGWHEKPSWGKTVMIGLVLGWIVLVRPTNVLIGLIFLLYGLPSKFRELLSHWPKLLLIGLLVILMFSPQMIYWKSVTGSWLYFSYGDEGFFFARPRILEGLLSFRKGWFIYTPLMALAFAGAFLRTFPREFRAGFWAFTVINIYVILSWWCWWYGGSFGLRAFIESHALMAIPLAALIERLFSFRPLVRGIAVALLLLVLSLNLFQSYQYKLTLIHWDSMTWRAYQGVFLKTKFPPEYQSWLKAPDYKAARDGKEER